MEEILQRELTQPEGTKMLIQQAHRAAARRTGPGETLRSLIINFLRFDTKEMILKKAWQKRVKLGNSPLFFEIDYTARGGTEMQSLYGDQKDPRDQRGKDGEKETKSLQHPRRSHLFIHLRVV